MAVDIIRQQKGGAVRGENAGPVGRAGPEACRRGGEHRAKKLIPPWRTGTQPALQREKRVSRKSACGEGLVYAITEGTNSKLGHSREQPCAGVSSRGLGYGLPC